MRWRLPSVPLYWNVACTAYACSPKRSCSRCTKKVCPLEKPTTGSAPISTRPSYARMSPPSNLSCDRHVSPRILSVLNAFWSHTFGSRSIASTHSEAMAVAFGVARIHMIPMLLAVAHMWCSRRPLPERPDVLCSWSVLTSRSAVGKRRKCGSGSRIHATSTSDTRTSSPSRSTSRIRRILSLPMWWNFWLPHPKSPRTDFSSIFWLPMKNTGSPAACSSSYSALSIAPTQ
mmetsp:Transcript_12257/g.42524  ORF Transcript_12257/g.42524 Transcript_12257/m.42524 type:complete len:231 (+) Transcript_12257:602-1294(+)